MKVKKNEHRTPEQIREHYEIEKELANKLRQASRLERRLLYSSLYDEMLRRVPLHPLLTRKVSATETEQVVRSQLDFLGPFLRDDITFLELGPGDCALSFELAKRVKKVYAVDVSDEITKASAPPDNFQLMLSDGCSVPVPPDSVDVAYSNQLMEHLHPDDAFEQLRQIHGALAPGGIYVCITPHRLTGPHDVSRYFDPIATGFHLKEYTTAELSALFKQAGFSRTKVFVGGKGKFMSLSVLPVAACEMLLGKIRYPLGRSIARSLPFRPMLGIRLVATK